MSENLDTIEGCKAFLARLRHEAIITGKIALRPDEFVRALELGAVQYVAENMGCSIAGQYVGEYSPRVEGVAVTVNGVGHADHL